MLMDGRRSWELSPQLMDAPRSLGQHVRGIVLSGAPISSNDPLPGWGHRRPLRHGLEQGFRCRRRLRQDRHPLPAGVGLD